MPTHEDEAKSETAPDVSELLGAEIDEVFTRFGPALVDRTAGADRWLRFEHPNWTLRLRARSDSVGGHVLVRSWTASFGEGFNTVLDALCALGLPPPRSPTRADDLRQPLRDRSGRVNSLTTSVQGGRIRSVSGFDEPPDW